MPDKIRHIRDPEDFAAAFDVSRETMERLEIYAALLRQWQKTINLVGPKTVDDVWHRHFADSAQLLGLAPTARTWADLGSGAGLPGLVIAILVAGQALPSGQQVRGEDLRGGETLPCRVTLIESSTRKCAFLREVVRQTGISGAAQTGVLVDILSTRIESAATQASLQAPQIVSARALAPLGQLLELAAPLFASHTVGIFLKGRDVGAELDTARKAWNFNVELIQSRTETDGRIVIVRDLQRNNEGMKP